MDVIVPFDATTPNTRLAPVLDQHERGAFARVMLAAVLETVEDAGHDPAVLATAPVECPAPVTVDDRSLTPAVNDAIATATLPVAVVMADLPLVTVDALDTLVGADAAVTIAPGTGGGTNALVVDHPEFRVDYHGLSYEDHRRRARECGAEVSTVDSFRLALDVDDPADLVEVLLHGDERVASWLCERGFTLDETGQRVSLERDDSDRA